MKRQEQIDQEDHSRMPYTDLDEIKLAAQLNRREELDKRNMFRIVDDTQDNLDVLKNPELKNIMFNGRHHIAMSVDRNDGSTYAERVARLNRLEQKSLLTSSKGERRVELKEEEQKEKVKLNRKERRRLLFSNRAPLSSSSSSTPSLSAETFTRLVVGEPVFVPTTSILKKRSIPPPHINVPGGLSSDLGDSVDIRRSIRYEARSRIQEALDGYDLSAPYGLGRTAPEPVGKNANQNKLETKEETKQETWRKYIKEEKQEKFQECLENQKQQENERKQRSDRKKVEELKNLASRLMDMSSGKERMDEWTQFVLCSNKQIKEYTYVWRPYVDQCREDQDENLWCYSVVLQQLLRQTETRTLVPYKRFRTIYKGRNPCGECRSTEALWLAFGCGHFKAVCDVCNYENICNLCNVTFPLFESVGVRMYSCPICLVNVKSGSRMSMSSQCQEHKVCTSCATEYIKSALKDRSKFPLKCPLYSCSSYVDSSVLVKLGFSQEEQNLFDIRTTEVSIPLQERVYCQKCSRASFREPLSPDRTRCTSCRWSMCGQCGYEWHGETKCQVQASAIDSKYSKPCPSCKTAIHHAFEHGCHHIKCPHCKTNFCYVCLNIQDGPVKTCSCPPNCDSKCNCPPCTLCTPGHSCTIGESKCRGCPSCRLTSSSLSSYLSSWDSSYPSSQILPRIFRPEPDEQVGAVTIARYLPYPSSSSSTNVTLSVNARPEEGDSLTLNGQTYTFPDRLIEQKTTASSSSSSSSASFHPAESKRGQEPITVHNSSLPFNPHETKSQQLHYRSRMANRFKSRVMGLRQNAVGRSVEPNSAKITNSNDDEDDTEDDIPELEPSITPPLKDQKEKVEYHPAHLSGRVDGVHTHKLNLQSGEMTLEDAGRPRVLTGGIAVSPSGTVRLIPSRESDASDSGDDEEEHAPASRSPTGVFNQRVADAMILATNTTLRSINSSQVQNIDTSKSNKDAINERLAENF